MVAPTPAAMANGTTVYPGGGLKSERKPSHPDTNPPRAPRFRDLSTRKVELVSQGIRPFSSKENGNEITSLQDNPLCPLRTCSEALTVPVWPPPPLLA